MTISFWNLAPPPGFKGLRDHVPLRVYVQLLPHWRQEGATYFVTFRLDDALPASKLHELGCYVVMPNHVHAVVRPLVPSDHDLEDVMQIWKGRSAREINQQLERSGTLWQRESYDRIIRDEEHLWKVIQYIGRNPARAGLPPGVAPLWINPEWAALGWDFLPDS